jgi:hypothetical protein
MRRFTAFLIAALALVAPGETLAKGGYSRSPEPKLVKAGAPLPQLSLSPGQILGGCGPKRTRDATTGLCRGPADFGN